MLVTLLRGQPGSFIKKMLGESYVLIKFRPGEMKQNLNSLVPWKEGGQLWVCSAIGEEVMQFLCSKCWQCIIPSHTLAPLSKCSFDFQTALHSNQDKSMTLTDIPPKNIAPLQHSFINSQPPSKLIYLFQGAHKKLMDQSCVSFDQHCKWASIFSMYKMMFEMYDGPYVTPFIHTLPCEMYIDLPVLFYTHTLMYTI